MVKFIHSHFKNFPAILLHYIREWLVSLSTQAFSLHWLHHLCRLSQASSYPFYLIFVLLTSPVFGVATATTLAFSKVGCLVDVTDIQVHGAIDDFVTMSDKVHSKAIIKETTVMITRHTWIDVCYLSQRLHASQRPYLIDHLLLV